MIADERDRVPRRNLHRHLSKNDNRFFGALTTWKSLDSQEHPVQSRETTVSSFTGVVMLMT